MTTAELTYDVVTDPDGKPIESNTPAWLLGRQGFIGASQAPAILGVSPWESPRDVALSKIATTISDDQTEAMEFGHLMEPIARTLFERRHGNPESTRHKYLGQIEPAPGLARSKAHPWLGASLDSVILEPDGQRVPGQIKNVTVYKQGSWAESEGGVPDLVSLQVVQECIVIGSDHGWVLPIFGGNHMPEPIRVDATPELVDFYLEYSERWWNDHIVAGVLPEPTIIDDLSAIWAGIMGESVDLTEDLLEKIEVYKSNKAKIKLLEGDNEALKLDVVSFMGEATEGWDRRNPAKPRLAATWRPYANPSKRFDRALLEQDHPEIADLLAEYTFDGKTPRPFLPKK